MLACRAAHLRAQSLMNAPPGAVFAPRAKVMINAFPVRVFARQHSPLNAANQNIKHGIEGEAHIQSARPASAFRRRNQVFDMLPLTIGLIAGVNLRFHNPNRFPKSGRWSTSLTIQTASYNVFWKSEKFLKLAIGVRSKSLSSFTSFRMTNSEFFSEIRLAKQFLITKAHRVLELDVLNCYFLVFDFFSSSGL